MFLKSLVCARLLGWCFVLSSLASGVAVGAASTMPEIYSVADSNAPAVTTDNLLESARFWPYQVALTEDCDVAGKDGTVRSLSAGMSAVLIRVEADGSTLRLDFGRYGVHEASIAQTDILDHANAIRLGTETKIASNFVYSFASRLVDPGQTRLCPYQYDRAAAHSVFLCVIARPDDPQFDAIASELVALDQVHQRWLTILFPVGKTRDAEVREILRARQWLVPFVYDYLSESYISSLLPDGMELPAVLLFSKEGRLYFSTTWSEASGAALEQALTRLEASRSTPESPSR